MTKYNNKKVVIDNIKFDSGREGLRYAELKLLNKVGIISNLKLQVVFKLVDGCVINGRKVPPIRYIADFTYYDKDDNYVIEDVKGVLTSTYKLKRHLMKSILGFDIVEIK